MNPDVHKFKLENTKFLVKAEDQVVTPEMAKKLLETNCFNFQRPLNPRRVKEISSSIINGTMPAATIAIVEYNGILYMADGQHTTKGIVETNKPCVCQIHEYKVNDIKDLNEIYHRYDGTRIRNYSVYLKNEIQRCELEWPIPYSKLVGDGILIYIYGDKTSLKTLTKQIESEHNILLSKQFKAELLGKNSRYGIAASPIFLNYKNKLHKNSRHLQKPVIFYTIMKTCDIDINTAIKFWIDVRDGANLAINMPQYKLREELKLKQKISDRDLYVLCAAAWNAYRKGKKPKFFKKCHREEYLPSLF